MPFITRIVSTFFFIGYFPFWPGTLASLAGLVMFYFLRFNPVLLIASAIFFCILGFIFSGRAERMFGKKDASCIVIDEVAGMLLCFIFIPYSLPTAAIGFLLFRIFDSIKPYPAGALQELNGSAGIMCDDIAAALYTNIILQLVLRFTSF